MPKSLLADLLIGGFFGALVVAVLVPNVPAEFRGPRAAMLVWVGVIVLYSLIRRLGSSRTH